ncbi:MAG: hypothetical protein WCT40_04040 [Candidatus Magasanikbacteria bacterium]
MLSPNAQKILADYMSLPFPGVTGVRCPYFINTRVGRRGQIRSLIGKGTPTEIVEEAKIISIQYQHGLFDHEGHCCIDDERHSPHCHSERSEESLSKHKIVEDSSVVSLYQDDRQNDCIRRFLIDNQLGIDCSGFATHILRAHFLETKKIDIAKKLVKNIPAGLTRKIIMRLRPVESIGVKSGYGNDRNTAKLGDETIGYDFAKIQTGDVVVMLGVDTKNTRNHILVITDYDGHTIKYAHARAWSSEGKFGHGVNTGEIKITAPGKGLLAQEWTEISPALSADLFHQANANETFGEAKNAKILEIRRIKL